MATVTMRYWAAAKAAAGMEEQQVTAETLADALAAARAAHGGSFTTVLARCSFLVDGNPVSRRAAESVELAEGNVIEVLPPFAGG